MIESYPVELKDIYGYKIWGWRWQNIRDQKQIEGRIPLTLGQQPEGYKVRKIKKSRGGEQLD